jgi:hypothetical protein
MLLMCVSVRPIQPPLTGQPGEVVRREPSPPGIGDSWESLGSALWGPREISRLARRVRTSPADVESTPA